METEPDDDFDLESQLPLQETKRFKNWGLGCLLIWFLALCWPILSIFCTGIISDIGSLCFPHCCSGKKWWAYRHCLNASRNCVCEYSIYGPCQCRWPPCCFWPYR